MISKGNLYLIPTTLGESEIDSVIPAYIKELINKIDEYIVEDEKSARRYLKKLGIIKSLQEIILHPLNKHTDPAEVSGYLKSINEGKNIGVISEAGCPGIADPGADVVALAHQQNIKVIPLVGPSSILLALIASGMNGQNFTFHGYLPIDKAERIKKLKDLERVAKQNKQTQIFIETPFRNQKLIEDILNSCAPQTLLCLAADITLATEFIRTMPVSAWKRQVPDLNKRPAIFLIY